MRPFHILSSRASRSAVGLVLAVCTLSVPFSASAAPPPPPPQVTSVSPIFVYTASQYGRLVDITLNGTNLAAPDTNGYTFPNDVKVFVRHSGDGFADAATDIKDWSPTSLGLEFDSTKYKLNVVGTIDFQVRVRGVYSNIISVPIRPYPTTAPVINSIGPASFLNTLPTQRDYMFRIYGQNTPENSTVAIGGQTLSFLAFADFAEGVIDVYVPENLRTKPGKYPVTVTSSAGTSNTVYLQIIARLSNIAERSVIPLRALATPTPTPLLLRTETHALTVPVLVSAAGATPAAMPRISPPPQVQQAAIGPPIPDDSRFTQRFRDLDRKVSPSLRNTLSPAINAVVSSLRSGTGADAVGVADTAVQSARPGATADQIAAMRVYVMTAALSMASPSSSVQTATGAKITIVDAKQNFRTTLEQRMQQVGVTQENALSALR